MALNTILPFVDSFSLYSTSQITEKWTVPVNFGISGYAYAYTATIVNGAGRCTDNALKVVSGGPVVDGCGPSVTCAPSGNNFYNGCGVNLTTFPVPCDLYRVQNGGTTDNFGQISARCGTDGRLSVVRGTGNLNRWDLTTQPGTTLATSTRAMQHGVFAFVELVATIHPSAGTAQIWVNGEKWTDTGAGVNTAGSGSAGWTGMNLGRVGATTGSATTMLFSHFYLHDGTGAAPWNGRLGDVRVEAINLLPTADGDLTGWTPTGGGAHYTQVNEHPPDTTTYVAALPIGTKDSYQHGALSVTSGPIYAVQAVPNTSKDNAAFKQLDAGFRIAGVNYLSGLPVAPGFGNYAYGIFFFQNNPATAAAWTVSDVNGAQTLLNVTT